MGITINDRIIDFFFLKQLLNFSNTNTHSFLDIKCCFGSEQTNWLCLITEAAETGA